MGQMNFLVSDMKVNAFNNIVEHLEANAFDNIVEHLDAHKRAAIWYNINEEYDIDSLSDFEYEQIYINKLEDLIIDTIQAAR